MVFQEEIYVANQSLEDAQNHFSCYEGYVKHLLTLGTVIDFKRGRKLNLTAERDGEKKNVLCKAGT